jgi:hypothetical protein
MVSVMRLGLVNIGSIEKNPKIGNRHILYITYIVKNARGSLGSRGKEGKRRSSWVDGWKEVRVGKVRETKGKEEKRTNKGNGV